MNHITLKQCPCGNTPKHLCITDGCQGGKYNYATGSCCGEWIVEFRANYKAVDSDEGMALAVAAWNESPRATPQAAVPDGLVDTLAKFNAWRKGEIHEWDAGTHSGPDPQEITKAIDDACAILSREATVPAEVPDGYTLVKTDTVLWLLGESGDFECPPWQFFRGNPAPYFWRNKLRHAILSTTDTEGRKDE